MKIVAIKARKLSINRCFYSLNQKKSIIRQNLWAADEQYNIFFVNIIAVYCVMYLIS